MSTFLYNVLPKALQEYMDMQLQEYMDMHTISNFNFPDPSLIFC